MPNGLTTPQETTLATRTVLGLTARNPEALRAALWSDEWVEAGLAAFHARLVAQKRDALRLYLEAIEAVSGKNERAIVVFCASLGESDPERVRRMVELARSSEGSNETDAYRLAKQLVRERIMSDPAERRAAMQEIFGIMDATPYANGANGNGGHA